MIRSLAIWTLVGGAFLVRAQQLDPASILKPPADSWPTYNGDYSGKRHSPIKQINTGNVGMMTMAWAFQTDVSSGPGLKSTPLLVDERSISRSRMTSGRSTRAPAIRSGTITTMRMRGFTLASEE